FVDGERPDPRRYVAAVAAVIDKRGLEAHLGEGVIDIGVRPGEGKDDRMLARQDVSAAQTVDLAHVGAAVDSQYDRVSFLWIFGILVHHDVYAFAGAAAHDGAPQHFHFW